MPQPTLMLAVVLLLACFVQPAEARQRNLVMADVLADVRRLLLHKSGNTSIRHPQVRANPEDNMNVTQLITSKGYPCEDYTVVTADGFLLSMQRIPHGRRGPGGPVKPVVFLQHGLLCSAADWLMNLPYQSLGFILADAGFDVWLGNSRGNTYSRRHVHLSPDMPEFWAWSWDEMAKYDLPAMVNFALKTSGQNSLFYVGHSQGTLQMFAHLSLNPSFNSKIKMFFALGPVTTVGHAESPIRYFSYLPDELLYYIFGNMQLLPSNKVFHILADTICRDKYIRDVCSNVLFLICGPDTSNLNKSRIDVYVNHDPAGTSVQNLVHYAQGLRTDTFQMYDYGSAAANQQHYNQSSPPSYDPSKVAAPVVLFYGKEDWLADPTDVEGLAAKLRVLKGSYELMSWNHLDFIWGIDANTLVYKKIIEMMQQAETTAPNL